MATVAPPPDAGLCARCQYVRALANRRGSVFVMCGRAAEDPRLRQYPQLPMLECHAFVPVGADSASQPPPDPPTDPDDR